MASSSAAVAVAGEVLDPQSSSCLEILNHYLDSLRDDPDDATTNNSNTGDKAKQKQQEAEDERHDELLRLVDFLYGSTTVEGALVLLDKGSSMITRIISHSSQRSLFLVQATAASSTTSHKRRKQLPQQQQQQRHYHNDPNYYLCLLPQHDDDHDEEKQQKPPPPWRSSSLFLPVYYCSCRSFFEKNSRGGTCSHSSSPNLCKHLLALRIMPALQKIPLCITTEAVSDYDFSEIVLNRLLPPPTLADP